MPLVGIQRAAAVLEAGLVDGRQPGDWQGCDRQEFVDARLRHLVALDAGDTSEDHEVAILANTLILAWFDAQERPQAQNVSSGSHFCTCGQQNHPTRKVCLSCSRAL